jgi:hypothetical protein
MELWTQMELWVLLRSSSVCSAIAARLCAAPGQEGRHTRSPGTTGIATRHHRPRARACAATCRSRDACAASATVCTPATAAADGGAWAPLSPRPCARALQRP